MLRYLLLVIIAVILIPVWAEETPRTVVVDSASRIALPRASIFDCQGKTVGFSDRKGRLPKVSPKSYPLTIRYLGFEEKCVAHPNIDTVFLNVSTADLPEYVVETSRLKALHLLAYVREYSALTSYTDTVFMFREKMVDFMFGPDGKSGFKGWSTPRVLTSRSYYRFTDSEGLDSVSGESPHHFSWSDWIGVETAQLPSSLRGIPSFSDTLFWHDRPSEIWDRDKEKVSVIINALAGDDKAKWGLAPFFKDGVEFESFHLSYEYDNVLNDSITPMELTRFWFDIESTGRSHRIFRFGKRHQPYYAETHAEVYILDRERISLKEAKKWENVSLATEDIGIYQSPEAPPLDEGIRQLIARVEAINPSEVRLDQQADRRMLSETAWKRKNFTIGNRALFMLKQISGISYFKSRKNFKDSWSRFRKQCRDLQ